MSNSSKMQKLIISFLILMIIVSFTGCSKKNSIVGTWRAVGEVSGDHPREYITFGEDGDGFADGKLTIQWRIENDKICGTVSSGSRTEPFEWKYSVTDIKLTLDNYMYEKDN